MRIAVTGHRHLSAELSEKAYDLGLYLAEAEEVESVLVGGAIGADSVVVDAMIAGGGCSKLMIVVPNTVLTQPAAAQKVIQKSMDSGANVTELKLGFKSMREKWGYMERNRWMVQNADRLFAVWDGRRQGGTWGTMQIAESLGIPIQSVGSVYVAETTKEVMAAYSGSVSGIKVEVMSAVAYLPHYFHSKSPEYIHVRGLMDRLKIGKKDAVDEVAQLIAAMPGMKTFRGVLVPVPGSRSDKPNSNEELAKKLVECGVGSKVLTIFKREKDVPSSRGLRSRRQAALTVYDHVRSISMLPPGEQGRAGSPESDDIMLVDDMIVDGTIMRACRILLAKEGFKGEFRGVTFGYAVNDTTALQSAYVPYLQTLKVGTGFESRGPTPWELRYVPADQLDPNPWNAQVMDSVTFQRLVKEIRDVGFLDPIQTVPWGGRYRILGGENRTAAAKAVGMTEVPSVVLTDARFQEEQLQRALVIRLNQLRGKIDINRFVKFYGDMMRDYEKGALGELLAFTDDDVLEKAYQQTLQMAKDAGLPSRLVNKVKKGKKGLKGMEGLGDLINRIFEEYGSTVERSFVMFAHGGRDHLFIECNDKLWGVITQMVSASQEDANDILLRALTCNPSREEVESKKTADEVEDEKDEAEKIN
jgi:hypothetical protein